MEDRSARVFLITTLIFFFHQDAPGRARALLETTRIATAVLGVAEFAIAPACAQLHIGLQGTTELPRLRE